MAQEFLASSLASRIGARIVDGELATGDVLRLEDIERESGASRSVCREAVKILESLSLVRSRRHVGVTVLPSHEWDALSAKVVHWHMQGTKRDQALEWTRDLRVGLEPMAARLAAERADSGDFTALTEAVVGMTAAIGQHDIESYSRHDREFHRALLAATRNPLYLAHVPMLLAYIGEHSADRFADDTAVTDVALHRDILEAIMMRDADAAESACRALVLGLDRPDHDVRDRTSPNPS